MSATPQTIIPGASSTASGMKKDVAPWLHIVLYKPLIHWNTGSVGRTCLGFGAKLHLIRPLGFDISDKAVKRAGLDYWPHVDLEVF